MIDNEESDFINPDKIIKNPQVRRTIKTPIEEEKTIKESIIEETLSNNTIKDNKPHYHNYGSTVKVELESGGRFGNPSVIVLKDYSARHIHDLVTTKEEDLFETLVGIINECVVDPVKFDVGNLTNDEFLEVMLGMKLAFDSPMFIHRWIHNVEGCQGSVSEYEEKKVSEYEIDLSDIKMTSIEESDEKIKEFYRSKFSEFSEEQFKTYLLTKYGSEIESTIEDEIEKVKIQEPFLIKGYDTDYEFSLIRIKDLLLAYKLASKEINHKIRIEKNKIIRQDENKESALQEKEEKIEKLNREKGRKVLNYAQAFSLKYLRRNGQRIPIESNEAKIKEYNNMPRNVMMNYLKAVETIVYGVNHEVELVCDLCKGTERGYLQRIVSPISLIPISDTEKRNSERKLRQPSGFDFYF